MRFRASLSLFPSLHFHCLPFPPPAALYHLLDQSIELQGILHGLVPMHVRPQRRTLRVHPALKDRLPRRARCVRVPHARAEPQTVFPRSHCVELLLVERNEEVEVPQRPKRNLDGEGDGVEGEGGGDGDGAATLSVDVDAFANDARLLLQLQDHYHCEPRGSRAKA
ncbi:hypothetical protein DFH08DRAFT_1013382 [Mycena albidolilacea]|uniref:Uncharacterized protein n=1 Tax=Mycena albidolilacea TaxID=1033008 RepID=A0AAD6ZU84_9AGAR|nr:hypothetical protein DFH08DRAFT_1013382 [Mycena albidolilacea]